MRYHATLHARFKGEMLKISFCLFVSFLFLLKKVSTFFSLAFTKEHNNKGMSEKLVDFLHAHNALRSSETSLEPCLELILRFTTVKLIVVFVCDGRSNVQTSRWRHYAPPKHSYKPATLSGVTIPKYLT